MKLGALQYHFTGRGKTCYGAVSYIAIEFAARLATKQGAAESLSVKDR